jgi:hypothetical protein
MKPLLATAAVLSVAALALPAAAPAADDGDLFPNDPAVATTVFGADGAVTDSAQHVGNRAFVDQLLARHAAAGVLRENTAAFQYPTRIRTGFSHPATRLAALKGRALGARGKAAVRITTQADGRRTMERGLAVEIATGTLRALTIDDARRFSADPLSGAAGLYYVYSIETNLPAT